MDTENTNTNTTTEDLAAFAERLRADLDARKVAPAPEAGVTEMPKASDVLNPIPSNAGVKK